MSENIHVSKKKKKTKMKRFVKFENPKQTTHKIRK